MQKVQKVQKDDGWWETKSSKQGEAGRAEAPDPCRKTKHPTPERVRPASPLSPLSPLLLLSDVHKLNAPPPQRTLETPLGTRNDNKV